MSAQLSEVICFDGLFAIRAMASSDPGGGSVSGAVGSEFVQGDGGGQPLQTWFGGESLPPDRK
eukprot:4423548-Lingulodinium_polyedra.AAC.1